MSNPYEAQVLLLICVCLTLISFQHKIFFVHLGNVKQESMVDSIGTEIHVDPSVVVANKLGRRYLIVYALAMVSDWLQGPYLYSLYREQYNFPERAVAVLFVTGFLSAGIAAPFIGVWADQYGRKRLCLSFCVTYTCASLLKFIDSYPVLLMGRVLGGVSTSILFSTFEAWLVSSATAISLPQSDLSTIMARATMLNGFVATVAGVVSNQLVSTTKTFQSPFGLSAVFLVTTWITMKFLWTENYGNEDSAHAPTHSRTILQTLHMKGAWTALRLGTFYFILPSTDSSNSEVQTLNSLF
ncbi:hypothetical protein AX17_004650 [Amanita inopinata Kibby_2008]|nr:hypothetical protein AX17_004650 [Amanita inopinata Kibby_2008]